MSTDPHAHPFKQGIHAAKQVAPAGGVLLVVALSVVLGYYFVPPMTDALEAIAALKLRWGVWFAMVSTAIFGGVLPIVIQQIMPGTRAAGAWWLLPYMALHYAWRGIEVDLLYRGEAWLLGDNTELLTILGKVCIDQFVYVPFWAIPTIALAYRFPKVGYSVRRLVDDMGPRWYVRKVLPVVVMNWCVWVPTVALIYCLPLPLQLPLQNIVMCLWAIMLMLLIHKPAAGGEPEDAVVE